MKFVESDKANGNILTVMVAGGIGAIGLGFLSTTIGLLILRIVRFLGCFDYEAPVDRATLSKMRKHLGFDPIPPKVPRYIRRVALFIRRHLPSSLRYADTLATLVLFQRVQVENDAVRLWLERRWYSFGTSFNAAISLWLAYGFGHYVLRFKPDGVDAWLLLTFVLSVPLLVQTLSCWWEMRAMNETWADYIELQQNKRNDGTNKQKPAVIETDSTGSLRRSVE